MTNQIVEKIQSRAYWRILIRPTNYPDSDLTKYSDMEPAIGRSAVRIRGWDFPHISDRDGGIRRQQSHIEHVTEWQHYLEYWRFYLSGQFIYLGGVSSEWRDVSELDPGTYSKVPGRPLKVLDVLFRFTEAFEFASRLSVTDFGSDEMHIEVGVHNIAGFQLVLPSSRAGFMAPQTSEISEFSYPTVLARELLIGDTNGHARRYAAEFFQRFGWNASDDILKSLQENQRH